jgi:three-Cys-motif partner protein
MPKARHGKEGGARAPSAGHRFGGPWTDQKLTALRKYLEAYRVIFTRSRASFFRTWYVDAFAGTGERKQANAPESKVNLDQDPLFTLDREEQTERDAYAKGSATIALELENPFDQYLFVERNRSRRAQLEKMIATSFPSLEPRCKVKGGDANTVLPGWCAATDWKRNRAVVFLDPYGMQVKWSTVQALGATGAVDLWLLFPIGQAVMRVLTRREPPPEEWANALDAFLGTTDWRQAFYSRSRQAPLFGEEESSDERTASVESVGNYFLDRLRTVFADVAPAPLPLLNSLGTPLYLLCFAAANKRGAPIAKRIAADIIAG